MEFKSLEGFLHLYTRFPWVVANHPDPSYLTVLAVGLGIH
jgi:hypothetical protein